MKPNVTIFAGAGASMAVNPDQFPTTVEFFKRLPDRITNQALFNQLVDFTKSTTGSDRVDIEQILWAAHTLRSDLGALSDGSSAAGYCLGSSNVRKTVGAVAFGDWRTTVPVLLAKAESLISDIDELVFDLYGYDPEEEELRGNWLSLLEPLWRDSDHLDIFTTNYDGVIENALAALHLSPQIYNSYLGVAGARRKHLNLDAWQERDESRKGLLTKLHGSVDWKRNGKLINISDAGFSGSHARHPIIYPGFKGISSTEFFDPFHEYLSYSIKRADIAVFIGFAFRDDHINAVIRDAIRDDATVFIVDPNQSVEFCSTRVRVRRLQEFRVPGFSPVIHLAKGSGGSKVRVVGKAT